MEMAFTHTCNTVIYATQKFPAQRRKPLKYRACVVDLLGLGIIIYVWHILHVYVKAIYILSAFFLC